MHKPSTNILLISCAFISISLKGCFAHICSKSEIENCGKGYDIHIIGAKGRICSDTHTNINCVKAVISDCNEHAKDFDVSLVINAANIDIEKLKHQQADLGCAGSNDGGGKSNGTGGQHVSLWIIVLGHFFPIILLISLF